MIYKSKNTVSGIPEWEFDTDTLEIQHITETGDEELSKFGSDWVKYHVHYSENNYPERLQKLVDNGEIYDYIKDLDTKVGEAIERQVTLWKETDKEYLVAVMAENTEKAKRLENNLRNMAQDVVFNAMVYV